MDKKVVNNIDFESGRDWGNSIRVSYASGENEHVAICFDTMLKLRAFYNAAKPQTNAISAAARGYRQMFEFDLKRGGVIVVELCFSFGKLGGISFRDGHGIDLGYRSVIQRLNVANFMLRQEGGFRNGPGAPPPGVMRSPGLQLMR